MCRLKYTTSLNLKDLVVVFLLRVKTKNKSLKGRERKERKQKKRKYKTEEWWRISRRERGRMVIKEGV